MTGDAAAASCTQGPGPGAGLEDSCSARDEDRRPVGGEKMLADVYFLSVCYHPAMVHKLISQRAFFLCLF